MKTIFMTWNTDADPIELFRCDVASHPRVDEFVNLPMLDILRIGPPDHWQTDWKVVAVNLDLSDDEPAYLIHLEPAEGFRGFDPACECKPPTPREDDEKECNECGRRIVSKGIGR